MSSNLTFGAYALPSYHLETDPPQGVFMRQMLDLLASAEPLGFDNIWLNEHHFTSWGGMLPSPPMALAALSQRTHRIRLGTSIAVLGLHHPSTPARERLAYIPPSGTEGSKRSDAGALGSRERPAGVSRP